MNMKTVECDTDIVINVSNVMFQVKAAAMGEDE
jgi:hypothetical protein